MKGKVVLHMEQTDLGWQPAKGGLMTRWAGEVDPGKVLPEYPRPQMVRDNWINLNGLWDYAIRPKNENEVTTYEGQILVPFPIESALSGVKRSLLPDERLWYKRTFFIPDEWKGQNILLHFGAVDWKTEVRINRHPVGEHTVRFHNTYRMARMKLSYRYGIQRIPLDRKEASRS